MAMGMQGSMGSGGQEWVGLVLLGRGSQPPPGAHGVQASFFLGSGSWARFPL